MKKLSIILFIVISYSCTTVTDSVVTSISEEEFNKVNTILYNVEDYRVNKNESALERALTDLSLIKIDEIYNNDYKGKILGLLAISNYYNNNKGRAKSYITDLEIINPDEELLWVAKSLVDENKALGILENAKNNLQETSVIDYYLAEAQLKAEKYGEAASTYDTILLRSPNFKDYYQSQRDLAYNFFKNPPTSVESGNIFTKPKLNYADLISAIGLETPYFNHLDKNDMFSDLVSRDYFFNEVESGQDVLRKDLSYFLFKLIAEKRANLNLLEEYAEFFVDNPSEETKMEMEGFSPIEDVPIYVYYFYPALYLIEEEIMELPDGERFYPLNNVSGEDMQRILSNLKERLD